NLYQQNPEEFFLRFMESLNGVQKAGGELIPTIRELGIINTRDADVTAKLAQNYELLEQSVNQANRSFQAGTYLHQESERIFTTLTARVQILSNQWENFLAHVPGHRPGGGCSGGYRFRCAEVHYQPGRGQPDHRPD